MRTINKVLAGVTIVAAGIGTVGAGSGAAFIDSATSTQHISTGTLSLSLSDGQTTSQGSVGTPAALTLAPIGPTGSSFSNYKTITITNTGNVPATVKDVELTASGDVSPLATDIHISIADPSSHYVCSGSVAHCTSTNLTPGGLYPYLAPGQSMTMPVSIYAGGNTGAPELTNADEGKVLDLTLTYTVTA